MRFYLHDRGDPSVGIDPVTTLVEVIIDNGSRELEQEEIDIFKKLLPDAINPDAYCRTSDEWMKDCDDSWPEIEPSEQGGQDAG
jgi:hypothetical protein